MIKREANLTRELKKYIEESGIHLGCCAIEVKVTVDKSLPFDAVQPHQLQALKNVRATFAWKIADDSRGVKPFDVFVLQNAAAYVAVAWLVPRKPKTVYLIPITSWLALQENSARKSLTEEILLGSKLRYLTIALPTNRQGHVPS
jgi:hypothetical protein